MGMRIVMIMLMIDDGGGSADPTAMSLTDVNQGACPGLAVMHPWPRMYPTQMTRVAIPAVQLHAVGGGMRRSRSGGRGVTGETAPRVPPFEQPQLSDFLTRASIR